MNISNEVDLTLMLEKHGWSYSSLSVGDNKYEFVLTHIFDSPIYAIGEAVCHLVRGNGLVSFKWFEEPGTHHWEIERLRDQQHVIAIKIFQYNETGECSEADLYNTIEFRIKQDHFVCLVFGELTKLYYLLKVPSFQKDRDVNFPYKEYFEIKVYLDTKLKKP